jgi:NAD(P)-dependent dehydrogenase (short-subunit alcohol dehydrogenase family)
VFLVGVREALPLMIDGRRIFAITYAEGSRTGGLQPWVGMGSAKAALESLVRYMAVACAKRGITVNAVSPGWTEDSVLNSLPAEVQRLIRDWHARGWTPMRRLGTSKEVGDVVALDHRTGYLCGRWRVLDESRGAARNSDRINRKFSLMA